MENSNSSYINLAPGRIRGEWAENALYLTGDLICTWFQSDVRPDIAKYLWFVAKQTHTSGNDTKPGVRVAMCPGEDKYWEVSHWANLSEEFELPMKVPNLSSSEGNIHNTYVAPEHQFQRVHSISPEMLDAFIMGKGVPSWYYYDLMGCFRVRAGIQHPLELLTTIRGTLLGLKAWLNFVNFNVSVTRVTPEEYYTIGEDDKELTYDDYFLPSYDSLIEEHSEGGWFKQIQQKLELPSSKIRLWRLPKFSPNTGTIVWQKDTVVGIKSKTLGVTYYRANTDIRADNASQWKGCPEDGNTDWRLVDTPQLPISTRVKEFDPLLPGARVWSDDIDFKKGDYVYVNRYTDGNEYYSTDKSRGESEPEFTYCGCDLYRARTNRKLEDYDNYPPLIGDTTNWELIASYNIKEYDKKWDRRTSPDNSHYRVDVSQVSEKGTEVVGSRLAVTDEAQQSMLTCYLKRLLDFLIPAWIRFESGLTIVDKRSLRVLSAAHHVSEIFSDTVGAEPYTLTIYPYVGFDPQDVNWIVNGEFSHTEAWRTAVTRVEDGVSVREVEDIWSPDTKIDWLKVQTEDAKLLTWGWSGSYMWREDYKRPLDRALIKVRLLSGQKLRLKSWNIYEPGKTVTWQQYQVYEFQQVVKHSDGKYYKSLMASNTTNINDAEAWKLVSYGENSPQRFFWRWQLLNFYHNVPRFGFNGHEEGISPGGGSESSLNRHIDLEVRPFNHLGLQSWSQNDVYEKA